MATNPDATVWGPATVEIDIPGPPGPPGPPNVLSIGTVTQATTPAATITGTSPSQVLNLQLPRGNQGAPGNPGPATNVTIGTVTTLAAGASATATITGVAPNLVLNLGIPQGAEGSEGIGEEGPQGPAGTPGLLQNLSNIGGGTGIFEALVGAVAQLKTLVPGDGVTITAGVQTITIAAEVNEAPQDGGMYVRQNGAWVALP